MCWLTVKRRKVMRTTMSMTMPKRIVIRIKKKLLSSLGSIRIIGNKNYYHKDYWKWHLPAVSR